MLVYECTNSLTDNGGPVVIFLLENCQRLELGVELCVAGAFSFWHDFVTVRGSVEIVVVHHPESAVYVELARSQEPYEKVVVVFIVH